jgi:L-serine/L-threonine ammonia-lyase
MAVEACIKFADEHRVLVEPSCGAALTVLYSNLEPLQDLLKDKPSATVLVIVCGGSGVSLAALEDWKAKFFQK